MKRTIRHFLDDIVEYSEKAQLFTSNISFEEFDHDDKTYLATVRALEIVGEAIRHIPEHIQNQYPQIPWHQIVGFRNLVIHEYFGIDKSIVWNAARNDTDLLINWVKTILQDIGTEKP